MRSRIASTVECNIRWLRSSNEVSRFASLVKDLRVTGLIRPTKSLAPLLFLFRLIYSGPFASVHQDGILSQMSASTHAIGRSGAILRSLRTRNTGIFTEPTLTDFEMFLRC